MYDIQEVFPESFDSKLLLKTKLESLQLTLLRQARVFCVNEMGQGFLEELTFEACILKTSTFLAYLLAFRTESPDPKLTQQIEQYFDQL